MNSLRLDIDYVIQRSCLLVIHEMEDIYVPSNGHNVKMIDKWFEP